MVLAIALACSVLATALAPTQAWAALQPKTVPLDFTQDTLNLQNGTFDLKAFLSVKEDDEFKDEWDDYGWKLVKDKFDDKNEDCWVYLVLADGFHFESQGPQDFAIKMPKMQVKDPDGGSFLYRETFIQLEGEASISIEGKSTNSAGLKLEQGVTLHPSPTSPASTKKLTVTTTSNGYGIIASAWMVADGITLNATGPRAGIQLKEGKPHPVYGADPGNLEARDGGVIYATGTADGSQGVDVNGVIRLYARHTNEGGKLYATGTGPGSVGAYARGNIILDTENTSPGAVAKNVLKGTGGTSDSVGVHSLSTISVSSESTIEGNGEEVGVQSDKTISVTGESRIKGTSSGLGVQAGTQGSADGKLEVTESSKVEGHGIAVFGELHAANSTFDVTVPTGDAFSLSGTSFTFENCKVTAESNGDSSAAMRVLGGKLAIDGGEFNLTAAGSGSVGLHLEDLANLPVFEAKDVEFIAMGQQAGVLVKGSGTQPTYPSPVKLDPNLAVVGGWLGSANYENPNAQSVWSYSPDGNLSVNPTFELQGASQTVKFVPNPKYWLKVDDKTLFASNDPADIVDAEIPGLVDFDEASRTLTLQGKLVPESAEGFDPTALPTARGIVARGLTTDPANVFTVDTKDGFLVTDELSDPAIDVRGPVRFTGTDKSALSVIGRVETAADSADQTGSLALEAGRMTIIAPTGTSAALATASAGANDADVNLKGGSLTVVAMGTMTGIQAGGSLNITGAMPGGIHQVISVNGKGAELDGAYSHTAGLATVLGLADSGLTVRNANGLPEAVTLAGDSSILGGSRSPSARGIDCYGLYVEQGNVKVKKGSHAVLGVSGNANNAAVFVNSGNVDVTGAELVANGAGAANGLDAIGGTVTVSNGLLDARGATGVRAYNAKVDGGSLNAIGHGATGLIASPDATELNKLLRKLSGASTQRIISALSDFLTGDGTLVEPTSGLKAGALSIGGMGASVAGAAEAQLPGFAAALAAAVNGGAGITERFGLLAETNVEMNSGTLNAFAVPATLSDGSSQAGGSAYGIRASEVFSNGGQTVALAKTLNGDTAIGIDAGFAAKGGTTTAYAFPGATTRMSVNTKGSQAIDAALRVAAGESAPGARVEATTPLVDHAYAYVTDGMLRLGSDFMKWDSLDTSSLVMAAAFDPADGQNKVSKEMMASIKGLNRATMIMSNGADLSKGSFLASFLDAYTRSVALDPQNSTMQLGSMLKGTGAALLFEHGPLFAKSTLHDVTDVDTYDFGSRYDAKPEFDSLRALMSDKKGLIHSVHFNYEGELPADTTVLMAVGDAWKSKPVEWAYSDHDFKALTTIASQNVGPFGVLEVVGQKALHQETAIMGEGGLGPVPPTPPTPPTPPASDTKPTLEPEPKPLLSTGDGVTPIILALLGILAITGGAAGIAVRRNSRR